MLKPHFLFVAVATLGSCQPAGNATTDPTAARPQCYTHYSEEDSSVLRLSTLTPAVEGRFTFMAADHSDGTDGVLRGKLHGDTLLADYWLNLEYTGIAAPVAFRRWGSGWVAGWGDITPRGDGRFAFTRPAALRFDTTRIFQPCACPPLPAKSTPSSQY